MKTWWRRGVGSPRIPIAICDSGCIMIAMRDLLFKLENPALNQPAALEPRLQLPPCVLWLQVHHAHFSLPPCDCSIQNWKFFALPNTWSQSKYFRPSELAPL